MQRYALIGGTRGYSQFRRVHEQIADYEYTELDVNSEEDLEHPLRDTRYSGFNIANPFKVEVIKYLDEISDDAKRAGAVDVVMRMPDGRLQGFNTEMAASDICQRTSREAKSASSSEPAVLLLPARTLRDMRRSIVIVSVTRKQLLRR